MQNGLVLTQVLPLLYSSLLPAQAYLLTNKVDAEHIPNAL
jgi:hypothetical protein